MASDTASEFLNSQYEDYRHMRAHDYMTCGCAACEQVRTMKLRLDYDRARLQYAPRPVPGFSENDFIKSLVAANTPADFGSPEPAPQTPPKRSTSATLHGS